MHHLDTLHSDLPSDMANEVFQKKSVQKFGGYKLFAYLCTRKTERDIKLVP